MSQKKVGKCPRCGGAVLSGGRTFECEDCGFSFYKVIAGRPLSDAEAGELLKKGKTKTLDGFRKKAGGTFSAVLTLDENGKTAFSFGGEETKLRCPVCGKRLMRTPRTYKCDDCGFTLWTSVAGKNLTDAQIKKLLNGEHTGVIKGFTSRAGKPFDADLFLEDGKVKFDFS